MDKMKRKINNKDARPYVENLQPFRGSLTGGGWSKYGKQYVVFSYGPQWPLYIYDHPSKQWFGNKEKVSSTTSRHASQLLPRYVEIHWHDKVFMSKLFMYGSYSKMVAARVKQTDKELNLQRLIEIIAKKGFEWEITLSDCLDM